MQMELHMCTRAQFQHEARCVTSQPCKLHQAMNPRLVSFPDPTLKDMHALAFSLEPLVMQYTQHCGNMRGLGSL